MFDLDKAIVCAKQMKKHFKTTEEDANVSFPVEIKNKQLSNSEINNLGQIWIKAAN